MKFWLMKSEPDEFSIDDGPGQFAAALRADIAAIRSAATGGTTASR